MNKSKTWSGYKLQGRTTFRGLPISIENERGTMRRGEDKDGHEWATFMHIPYGYIRLTEGTDGDHVDCYLGTAGDSDDVFVVHQNDPTTGKYDEDKVMLGFRYYPEARRAYMRQYDRPGFFGSMDHYSMEEFKRLLEIREGVKLKKALMPIQMPVNRKGKTFMQTYWVSPKEARQEAEKQQSVAAEAIKPRVARSPKSTAFVMGAEKAMYYAPEATIGVDKVIALQQSVFGDSPKPSVEDVRETAAQELEWALTQEGETGEGWYSEKIMETRAILTQAIPSLADDGEWDFFSAILALTSPRVSVALNMDMTVKIYSISKQTGTIPTRQPSGKRWPGPSSEKILTRLNDMIKEHGGTEGFTVWLKQGSLGQKLKGLNPSFKGTLTEFHPNAKLFGPKVGAFYNNLIGEFSLSTIDTWVARSWQRWNNNVRKFQNSMGHFEVDVRLSPRDKKNIDALFASLSKEFDMSKADVQAVLWYYEKRLYNKLGVKKSLSEDIGYDEAAKRVYNSITTGSREASKAFIEEWEDAQLLKSSSSDEKGKQTMNSELRTPGGIREGTLIKSNGSWYAVIGGEWLKFHVYSTGLGILEKAKYIRRWKGPNGKWQYQYKEEPHGLNDRLSGYAKKMASSLKKYHELKDRNKVAAGKYRDHINALLDIMSEDERPKVITEAKRIAGLEKAVKIKSHYSPEEVKARGMRWVTIRGARLLLQGTSDGGWVVVGGAGGKLNHMRVDQILGKEEYAEKRRGMKEQAKKELRALSKEELAEQREKRKVEVKAKRQLRTGYEEQVRGIVGVTEEGLRSQITGKMMDEITDRARSIVETRKRKILDVGDEQDIEREKEKIVQQEVKKTIKNVERRALDVLMNDYEGAADPNAVKKTLKGLLDKDKAMEIMRARQEFKKAIKKIGVTPPEPKQPRLKIGEVFAATSKTTDEDILAEVKTQLETAKNIALYDKMNAQSGSIQKYVSQGNASTVNGVISDVFGGGAVFGPSAFDELGVEAVARAVAVHIQESGKAKEVKAALEKFSRNKREKIVTDALNSADERFNTADDLRSLAKGDDDAEGLMSMAQANGYALKEIVAAQQELGSAVGSLQAMAHIVNALEDPPADAVLVDIGTDLHRARQRAKRAGLNRGDYKIRTQKKGKRKRLVLEIPKESISSFIQSSQDMQKTETKLDRIKMHKENTGYKPPGIKGSITLKPSQEAGLHFFRERKNVILDFEAGLGKTAVGYAAAMEAMNNMGAKKVLVITPAKLRNQFKDDAKVFLEPEYQKMVKNTGTMKDRKTRLATYERESGIDIIGHDTLTNDADAIAAAGYDMVIVDEIHEMTPQGKGVGSKRYQGMVKLRDIPMKIGMSGTNIKNSKTELYRKVDFVDPDHNLGTLTGFENKYKGLNQGTSAFQESSNDAFRKEVSPYMYTQRNNLDVSLEHSKERVPLTKVQRVRMREIMKTYMREKTEKVIGAAARRDADMYRIVQDDAFATNSKAGRIVELMKTKHLGEKAVIHVQGIQALTSTKQRIEAEFGKGTVAVIKGEGPEANVKAIKLAKTQFNDPDSPIRFIIGTKSMEAGHNLQGGTVVFNLDQPDTYASVDQRIKRAYRTGQDRNVAAYTLSGTNPLDLRQEDLIRKKKREMGILGNPQAIEGFDGTGFLAYLNATEREAGIGKQVAASI